MDKEGQERADEASPGCEIEEMSSTSQVPKYTGGHADSTTEVQDLEKQVIFVILNVFNLQHRKI